jgi:hypothetical protein
MLRSLETNYFSQEVRLDIDFNANNAQLGARDESDGVEPSEVMCASTGSQIDQIRCMLDLRATDSAPRGGKYTPGQCVAEVCSAAEQAEGQASERIQRGSKYQVVFQPAMSMFYRLVSPCNCGSSYVKYEIFFPAINRGSVALKKELQLLQSRNSRIVSFLAQKIALPIQMPGRELVACMWQKQTPFCCLVPWTTPGE